MPFGRNVVITTDSVVIKVVMFNRIMKPLIGSRKELVILFPDIVPNGGLNHWVRSHINFGEIGAESRGGRI